MARRERILLIDDDESLRRVLGMMIEQAGYEVETAETARAGLVALERQSPDLVLSDIKMPGMDGIALLAEIKKRDNAIPVIILTAFGTVETAVEAMKQGAADYLAKPVARDDLLMTLKRALRLSRLETENADLRESLRDRYRFDGIIGLAPAMKTLFDTMNQIATTDATVLITGESGTGKELVARALHFNSRRQAHRMVTVNCAAIPHELLESELFGHVRGSFTGAIRDKVGKFEQAHDGTIFLDEVGSMPLTLQAKLLRVLQEREIERIGGDAVIGIDVRIVAATNRPLPALIASGDFREDLYYRLNVVPLSLPPLRERSGDIPVLVEHFSRKYGGGANVRFTPDAVLAMNEYSWPGNVRELENIVERVIVMRKGDTIDADTVRSQLALLRSEAPMAGLTLPEIERKAVVDALRACSWNQSLAARTLGVPRHVLLYRIRKFEIEIPGK